MPKYSCQLSNLTNLLLLVLNLDIIVINRPGDAQPDRPERRPFERVDGRVQTGLVQSGVVDVDQSVTWDDPAVLLGCAPRDQTADHDHSVAEVLGVLELGKKHLQ